MPEKLRQSKMLSLRLSAAEYEIMRTLCEQEGTSNVSEFARIAIRKAISHAVLPENVISSRFRELDARLSAVEDSVLQLSSQMKQPLVSVP